MIQHTTRGWVLGTIPILFICSMLDPGLAHAQVNDIRNFRVVSESADQLILSVDYTWDGRPATNDLTIHATPEERGGLYDPRKTVSDEVPLNVGDNTVTLRIARRPDSQTFNSEMIRVCMSTRDAAILCKNFAYPKTWATPQPCVELLSPAQGAVLDQGRPDAGRGRAATSWTFTWSACSGATRYHLFVIGPGARNPIVDVDTLRRTSYVETSTSYVTRAFEGWTWKVRPFVNGKWGEWSDERQFDVNPVQEPTTPQTCTISGQVSGQLVYDVRDDRNQPLRLELTHMIMTWEGMSAPRRARIQQGRYSFIDVPAGITYTLNPMNFRSEPQQARVNCRRAVRHHPRTFTITGPPRYE